MTTTTAPAVIETTSESTVVHLAETWPSWAVVDLGKSGLDTTLAVVTRECKLPSWLPAMARTLRSVADRLTAEGAA